MKQEEIEAHKKDWELDHLKSLREEAERQRAQESNSETEEILTISRDEVYDQVIKKRSSHASSPSKPNNTNPNTKSSLNSSKTNAPNTNSTSEHQRRSRDTSSLTRRNNISSDRRRRRTNATPVSIEGIPRPEGSRRKRGRRPRTSNNTEGHQNDSHPGYHVVFEARKVCRDSSGRFASPEKRASDVNQVAQKRKLSPDVGTRRSPRSSPMKNDNDPNHIRLPNPSDDVIVVKRLQITRSGRVIKSSPAVVNADPEVQELLTNGNSNSSISESPLRTLRKTSTSSGR